MHNALCTTTCGDMHVGVVWWYQAWVSKAMKYSFMYTLSLNYIYIYIYTLITTSLNRNILHHNKCLQCNHCWLSKFRVVDSILELWETLIVVVGSSCTVQTRKLTQNDHAYTTLQHVALDLRLSLGNWKGGSNRESSSLSCWIRLRLLCKFNI